jgi:hypothetical protein
LRLHDPVGLQLAVGPGDGARRQADLAGEVPDGGKPAAGLEATHGDHDGQLGPQLFEAGDGAGVVEAQHDAAGEAVLVGEGHPFGVQHRRSL